MRSILFLCALALSLFAALSAATQGTQSADRVPKLSSRYTEKEPSAMFSKRQLVERPTRAKGRRLAARASAQPTLYNYNIIVTKPDGHFMGYLNQYYVFTTDKSTALAVAAPSSSSSSNLVIASSGNNNVGVVVDPGSNSDTMAKGSFNSLLLTNSAATPAGSGPANPSNDHGARYGTNQKAETAVWQYSSWDGTLDAVWVNPDMSTIVMSGVVEDGTNYVYLPGDADKFISTRGNRFQQVAFKLAPI